MRAVMDRVASMIEAGLTCCVTSGHPTKAGVLHEAGEAAEYQHRSAVLSSLHLHNVLPGHLTRHLRRFRPHIAPLLRLQTPLDGPHHNRAL